MMFNSCVTMFSISFVSYYKICSFINEHYKKNIIKNEKNIDTNNKTITITSVSCEELNKT
jgi:hypothetical protein